MSSNGTGGGKFNLSRMNWGGLTAILVVLLALMVSPIDICSGDIATGVGLIDDAVYLIGVAKVIWEMVEKQKNAKRERDEKKRAQNEAAYTEYRDVENN